MRVFLYEQLLEYPQVEVGINSGLMVTAEVLFSGS